jgi:hypothetical protein
MCCSPSSSSLNSKLYGQDATFSASISLATGNRDDDDNKTDACLELLRQTLRGSTLSPEHMSALVALTHDSTTATCRSPNTNNEGNNYHTTGKRVRFDDVLIRYHGPVLGDNPACPAGAPVELSWTHFRESRLSVDEHESRGSYGGGEGGGSEPISSRTRPQRPPLGQRRRLDDLKLTPVQRRYRLASAGYTRDEIRAAQLGVRRVQRERAATRARLASRLGRLRDAVRERAEGARSRAAPAARIRRRTPPPPTTTTTTGTPHPAAAKESAPLS